MKPLRLVARVLVVLLALAGASAKLQALSFMFVSVTGVESFPSANPDSNPVVPGASPVTLSIFIFNPNRETISVSVQADGPNLTSAVGDLIPVGKVSWTATSSSWAHSTAVVNPSSWGAQQGPKALTTAPVTVITGNDGLGQNFDVATGTLTLAFLFQNSWLYSTGAYSQSITWTVTAL